jgi:glycosyltransferase involved in cell wall biosynthesis
MNILVIADPILAVPPVNYGGTERIVALMTRGLVQRGHKVHLFAGEGSRLEGARITEYRPPSSSWGSRALRKIAFQFRIYRAAARADLVINHGRLDYLEVLYRTKKPMIHWFHNPLIGNELDYVLQRRKAGDLFVGVSHAQVSGDARAGQFEVVPNAVDLDAIPFTPEPKAPPYVAFLGRLTRNKGVHLAIDAAQHAGVKLVIGGSVPNEPGEAEYFEAMIRPRLGPQCEWIGPYDEKRRLEVLGGAQALLFPIQWPEPFGLVMIEALASGVPVIAWRRASTPEVVGHGLTGFLCDSVEEMAAAIGRVSAISRRRCRAAAEENFGVATFIDAVEALAVRAVGATP